MNTERYPSAVAPDTAPDASSLSSRRGVAILLLLSLVQFMDVLDASILNIALPSIKRRPRLQPAEPAVGRRRLHPHLRRLPPARRPRRPICSAAAACSSPAWSSSPAPRWPAASRTASSLLIGARFAQGVGAAMLSPAALSTLTSTFRSTRDRNTALGVWAAVSGHRRRRRRPVRRPAHARGRLALGAVRQRPLQRDRPRRRLRPAQG